jgi:hypothetical protein
MVDHKAHLEEAVRLIESVKDELLEMDELIQIHDKVEGVVMANPEIQGNNGLFYAYQITHADSTLMRLRRLTDDNRRTGSLYQIARHISAAPEVFSKAWFYSFYATSPVAHMMPAWWSEHANAAGDHICPIKMMAKADDLRAKAKVVSDWISQNVAHLDISKTVPTPKWEDFHQVLSAVTEFFTWMYTLLTSCSLVPHVTIVVDWEEALMIPWMPMSTRVKRLRSMRAKGMGIEPEQKPSVGFGPPVDPLSVP